MSYGGRIAILPGQEAAEEFSTLAHELAHELLHKAERRTATTKTVRETEAEAMITVDAANDRRSAEEVLLATIDATADDKLTRFAIRLALSGHVGIPRENEFDFLTEAEVVFALPQNKGKVRKTKNAPITMPKAKPKKTAKKQAVA